MLTNTVAEQVHAALERGARVRPVVGGFPYLAECLRAAGVSRVTCVVPAMTTLYATPQGSVVVQGEPLVAGTAEVSPFDADALVAALRRDQEGRSTYPEFVAGAWAAGVVSYDVDLDRRTCTYRSADGREYVEEYRPVTLA